MDGVTELALKIKNLETTLYSPMIGTIIFLPVTYSQKHHNKFKYNDEKTYNL